MEILSLERSRLAEATRLLVEALPWDPFVERVAEEKLFGGNAGREGRTFAAIENGDVVGLLAQAGRWIKLLCVAPSARRHGIGSALLDEAIRAAGAGAKLRVGDHPANYLTPGIDPRYEEGLRFLRARGFAEVGSAPNLLVPLKGNERTTRAHARALEERCALRGYRIRRAEPSDSSALEHMITETFSRAQAFEISRALEVEGVHIAEVAATGVLAAFAAHDGNSRGLGWFGPAGTRVEHRGHGVGECLLVHALADVAERGQSETIVAWVGPIDFYRRAVGAEIERTFVQLERRESTS